MQHQSDRIILCDLINPLSDTKCEYLKDAGLIIVNGKIKEIGSRTKILELALNNPKYMQYEVLDFIGKVAMPAFYDMHFHWVQDDVRLMPKDSLLEWLSKYTWPYEAKFKSKAYTNKRATQFKKELIRAGTLGGLVYASIHPHSVDIALKEFVGNFSIGNVLMNINSPKYLTQSDKEIKNLLDIQTKKHKSKYAVTPRFAITTSPEMMLYGAKLAKKHKSFIQTHLSETTNEIDFVLSIYRQFDEFKNVKTYTEIYQKSNILGPKTVMGHGIHLSCDELKILAKTKTSIAHCPTSNAPVKDKGLGSGLFDFKKTEKFGVRWALGSDIGGGPYLSMLDVMNSFVGQNKKAKRSGATYTKALYRSTLAGAQILGDEKFSGNFKKGKWANMVLFDYPFKTSSRNRNIKVEELLEKIISKNKTKRELYDRQIFATIFRGINISC